MGVLTVAAIAGVGLLATLTFYVVSDHRAAAEAKKTEIDKTAIAPKVTDGLQGLLNNGDATKNYHIQFQSDLTLFQLVEGGSEYRGSRPKHRGAPRCPSWSRSIATEAAR
jgi:hypothetical protein